MRYSKSLTCSGLIFGIALATACGEGSDSSAGIGAGGGGSPLEQAGSAGAHNGDTTGAPGGRAGAQAGAATVPEGGSATGGAGGAAVGGALGNAGDASAGAGQGGVNQGGASGGASLAGAGGKAAGAAGAPNAPYNPCPPAPADCKIMPFGDSITDGYLAQRGGYRIPLFQRAHQEGKHLTFVGSATNGPAMVDGVPFPQHHEGHSAYTINDEPLPAPAHKGISPFVKTSIPAYHPDIVLLMIRTNDVDNSIDLPNVPTRLGALIDSIIALDAHTLIVVAQITPTMQDPLNARIQTYNAAIPAVVQTRAQAGKHVAP